MKKIKLTYDFHGIVKTYITDDPKDYERVVNIIHSNPDKYKVLNVEHIQETQGKNKICKAFADELSARAFFVKTICLFSR